MKSLKTVLAIALVFVTVFAITAPALAAYSTMYVAAGGIGPGETVRLRKTPSTSGTILANVPYGRAVQAEYYNSTWHRVTWAGYSGYMMSMYLTSTKPPEAGWLSWYGPVNLSKTSGEKVYIKNLQADLMKNGYDLAPYYDDGFFGEKTYQAVRTFQRDNMLDVDGIAGPETKSTLYALTHGNN